MHIIVKKGPERMPDIDRDPVRKKAEMIARRNVEKMQFPSEGARRDYERSINSNPRNIYGGPEFFPPVEIKSFVPPIELTEAQERRMMRERLEAMSFAMLPILCVDCTPSSHSYGGQRTRVTDHSVSSKSCFCSLCGKEKPYRIGPSLVSQGENDPLHQQRTP